MRNLPSEMQALFASRHYRSYRFLLTLSDPLGTDGLEHHECSDNRTWERFLIDKDARYTIGYLLPHEFIHSWNGKYRRPAGLATADFQQPMDDELLWVYEGLTHYLCYMMTARAGFETPEQTREMMAYFAARLDHTPGRTWRPLIDTAVAAQLLYDQPAEGAAWRRSVDYYNEGMLVWLDADVTMRQKTNGRKSLDDFCRLFFAGDSGAPSVKTYTRDNVQTALRSICPLGWQEFFNKRIYRINGRIPIEGVENGGWRFVYDDTPNLYQNATENTRNILDTTFTVGMRIGKGAVVDIVPGSPADQAGVPVGSKLLAVNGRRYSDALLREAIAASARKSGPIDLLAENQEFSRVYHVDYHNGLRYPHLRRDEGKPDLLSQIMAPLRPAVK
jgi:predicted metalloprotease with PDZ domain